MKKRLSAVLLSLALCLGLLSLPALAAQDDGISSSAADPGRPCTRAQAVALLWQAAGSPEPESGELPFSDVSKEDSFAKAVLWAAEQGITAGITADTFAPDSPCTRAQAVTLIYRTEQAKGGGFTGAWMFRLPFADAAGWAYEAIAWCYKEGITAGTAADTFSPDAPCTCGQMETFLQRYFGA